MLPMECYLRRMAAGLDRYQRLVFESLVTASDIAAVALARLRAEAAALDLQPVQSNRVQRIGMLSDAWTIIDALHTSRILLNGLRSGKVSGMARGYLALTKPALSMRNAMDHLPQKLGNFSRRQGLVPPLYGAVRYVRAAGEGQHSFVTLPFGSSAEQSAAMIMTPGAVRGDGVTSIMLEAFGVDFALEPACAELEKLLREISVLLEYEITKALTLKAGKNSDELAKALAPMGYDLVISLTGPQPPGHG